MEDFLPIGSLVPVQPSPPHQFLAQVGPPLGNPGIISMHSWTTWAF